LSSTIPDQNGGNSNSISSSETQETKLVSGTDVVPLAIAFIQRATASYLRASADNRVPRDQKAAVEYSKVLFTLNPEFKFQLITDLQRENLAYYKSLVEIGVEVRHIDKNKISFALSKNEYVATDLTVMEEQVATGSDVPREVIWSNKNDVVSQAGQIFQMMWRMSVPSESRIRQLEEDGEPEETRLIENMHEVYKLGTQMTEDCKESALLIVASPKTITRNAKMFERLSALQRERHFSVRILSPGNDISAMKILPNAEWRKIEPMNVSITIYDMKRMFITQYSNTEADTTQTAVFSNIYTTNKHTIIGIASVFDALWRESELREMEERTRKQAQLLQDILTHDIRNYNQVSRLSAELLLERLEASKDEEGARLVEDLLEAIDGASSLVERGKKLGKILSEEKPELGAIDLVQSLQRSLTLVRQAFPTKLIREETEILHDEEEKKAYIKADELVDEVFTNVFSNSTKYTDSNTVPLWIKIERDEPYFKVSISDDGIGIPVELKDKIFDRFVAGARGSGLGMSIIHALVVSRYNGKITVEDGTRGGSTIRIWLPIAYTNPEQMEN